MQKPILILIAGRPGSGKTTLADLLGRRWHMPVLSRDRIKEGMLRTLDACHDDLPPETNLAATRAFFDAMSLLIEKGVSLIAEAAFQHEVWSAFLAPMLEKADIRVLICSVDGRLALDRFLARGFSDPSRRRFHGERDLQMALRGETPSVSPFEEPHLNVPSWHIDTTDGYSPSIDEWEAQVLLLRLP